MRKFKEERGGISEKKKKKSAIFANTVKKGALPKPALKFTQISMKKSAEITHAYTVVIGVNMQIIPSMTQTKPQHDTKLDKTLKNLHVGDKMAAFLCRSNKSLKPIFNKAGFH